MGTKSAKIGIEDLINNVSLQLSLLCPEIQSAIHIIEDEYSHKIARAKHIRQNIIDTTYDLDEANKRCNLYVTEAVNTRRVSIKSLKEQWNGFYYDHPNK